MEGQWRSEIPEDVRKKMITEMYHELARISGEVDKQKVWGSAAKFELMLWSSSPDRNSYLMKMQRKIMSLKKKPGPNDMQQQANMMTNANNVVTSNAINNAASGLNNTLNMNMNSVNVNATMNAQQYQQNHVAQQNSAMAAATNGLSSVSPALNPAATASGNASSATPMTSGTATTTSLSNPPQQQAQQWLQRIQVQFQAQQRQLLHTQNQETQQLRQQHMNQQQQLSQQHQQQGVAPDMRRQQLQTLQQQHQLARTRLQHLHKSKQQQLQRKQQQYLMQKQHQLQQQQQQGALATATTNSALSTAMMATSQAGVATTPILISNATTVQNTVPPVSNTQGAAAIAAAQRGVKPDQIAAAHTQQAAMREMQRAQNTSQLLSDSTLKHQPSNGPATNATTPATTVSTANVTTTSTTSGNDTQTYVERLKEMKQKYWDDLVIVYREFERMVKQKPANQQQERINTFLVNLKRIIALLQQDPSKVTSSNKNDLDRVEAHIHKQVLPILDRLKNKTRAATGNAPISAVTQQEQLKKAQEAQRLAHLQEQQKKMQEQQKAEVQRKLFEEQKKKMQLEAAAAAVKKQEIFEQQRKQKEKQLQAQQVLLQQQQRQQLLAQQQAQLKQNQMSVTAQQQSATSLGVTEATTAASMLATDNSLPSASVVGSSGSPTSLGSTSESPIDMSTLSPVEATSVASLTPAQYQTFKLPEARKQQLTAQHAKLREQQQELIMQQSRVKTPSHQAKLAQQAQRVAQMINKISQQLVQCKLAEEYEQSKNMGMTPIMQSTPGVTATASVKPECDTVTSGVTGTSADLASVSATSSPGLAVPDAGSVVDATAAGLNSDAAASGKMDDGFKSVLPDMTGLGASEKLLTAVAAYEKHKPEVLKRGSARFSRIAIAIGAKLNTSYVVS
ncbi:uncharacterized protein PHALS_05593 [Plasmopara halstedii]|uniref:Mediator complex subunit 15 KIX domain-containing protein n=1 Tax=Plasmopara halstedii TaxID=4781 RepID=A0A0P1B1X9_PLAHL|nr:uncharacterized protein PHALS_05593 [Plasmopara halstedii]CEG48119.1 hypothetical protein PHALS_05593 [Plasmopara halstedii]|eukprot:XP_024584488.1 hypothetical protein PHALS_05593 [Plasmopara halstedii]